MYSEPGRDASATNRSSRRRGGRRNGWRNTARVIGRATTPDLSAVPDGGRQLSDGLLVEASVVARLLRIRLLAIDASLVITPAKVGRQRLDPATPRPRVGTGLAAAERSLREGAASLAASRPPP
jgi:hypothetical protein